MWPPAEFRSEEEKQQFYLSNWIIASAIVVGGAAIVFFAVATNNAAVSGKRVWDRMQKCRQQKRTQIEKQYCIKIDTTHCLSLFSFAHCAQTAK